MSEWLPWDSYPGLTQDRLLIVADIIRSAREGAADDHRPELYETNWSLGVRGYERMCGALTWKSKDLPWLTIVTGGGGGPVHFVMNIGPHPVRPFRGDPDDVPPRYQQASLPEVQELQRALALDGHLPHGRCLRIAIDNGTDGRPANIFLLEMDDETGETLNTYMIPRLAASTVVTPFMAVVPVMELPPVSAEAISSGQHEEPTGSDD